MKTLRAVALVGLLLCVPFTKARADNIFGEFQRLPDDIERGFSVGSDFGLLFVSGLNGAVVNPGFQLGLTIGYDLFEYLSVESVNRIGISEADLVLLDGGINNFTFYGALKAQVPLGRLYPFVEGGGGLHLSKPDVVRGSGKKLAILMSGGLEYYTYLRHYSLFAKATYEYIDQPIDMFSVSAGIRYTF